jgi:hypothetical protein
MSIEMDVYLIPFYITVAIIGALSVLLVSSLQAHAANTNLTNVTFEGTAMSTVDALPGHQSHQAVVVLPARLDGKLWVGTISWTSSKPVELRLLYDYNFNLKTDAAHGKPITTQLTLQRPGQVGISLIKPTNVITTGGNYFAGSVPFIAKAVALHNIQGIPFTANYAVDAVAKPLTK